MTSIRAVLPAFLRPEGRALLTRIGARHDGGYIVNAAILDATDAVLSFGLGLEWTFEEDLLRYTAIPVIHAYDHTLDPFFLARKFLGATAKYFFNTEKYGARIRAARRYGALFSNSRIRHFKERVGSGDRPGEASLATIMGRLSAGSAVYLKCDIEGSEYEIAPALIAAAPGLTGLSIELHDVDRRIEEVRALVEGVKVFHTIDHLHINNYSKIGSRGLPSVIEMSFSRRGLGQPDAGLRNRFAALRFSEDGAELDAPNDPGRRALLAEYS